MGLSRKRDGGRYSSFLGCGRRRVDIGTTGTFEHEDLGYILVTYRVHPEEDGQFGAECLELGVRTCGDSVGEAFDAIADAALLYLNSLERHGERARVFAERGIAILTGEPHPDGAERNVPVRPFEYVHSDTIRLPASVA
jgi:predicted RNase H-like HicB family nuclease